MTEKLTRNIPSIVSVLSALVIVLAFAFDFGGDSAEAKARDRYMTRDIQVLQVTLKEFHADVRALGAAVQTSNLKQARTTARLEVLVQALEK